MEQSVKAFPFQRGTRSRQQEERRQLQACLEEVRRSINQAYVAFNMADDADLIESCVFEINALQARYNYLLKQAKWLEEAEV